MRKFRLIMIIVCSILIAGMLLTINYNNLISRSNLGAFLGITAMILTIISAILSTRYEKKK